MKKSLYVFIVFVLSFFFLSTVPTIGSAADPIYSTEEEVQIYNPYYIGVFGSYIIPENLKFENGTTDEVQLDNSWGAGIKAGYIFPVQWLAAELEYDYLGKLHIDDPGTGNLRANNIMANLILRYPEGMIRPYIGVGVGWSCGEFKGEYPPIPATDEYDNALAWQGIAGINLEITPSWSADFAYRYVESEYAFNHRDANARDHTILVGLNYHFGGTKPVVKEEAVVEEKAPVVVPAKCPDTPEGCIVDADGCPIDSDNDGVCDGLDQCPDTPAGCAVDENGCPIDSDKDGVIDCLDKCPDTPENAKVDADGCPYFVSIRLAVEFDFDKAVVKPQYMEEIKKVGDFIKAHPNLDVTIEGHTDNIGSAAYNQKLSERRAEAVKKVLVEQENIDPQRITAVGYGLTKPIADNGTREGRQKNRRVQAVMEAQALK